jgi:hypothetical protein
MPRNCEQLVAMRKARNVPGLPILVSLVGPLDFNNLTLLADASKDYDWRALTGLEVEVFTAQRVPMHHLIRVLAAIAAVVPSRIILAFNEGPRVDCGESRVVFHPDGDFKIFDWLPMAIGTSAWAPSKSIVRALWKAVASGDIPTPYDQAMTLVEQIAKENRQ